MRNGSVSRRVTAGEASKTVPIRRCPTGRSQNPKAYRRVLCASGRYEALTSTIQVLRQRKKWLGSSCRKKRGYQEILFHGHQPLPR
jgi:hypothetical protein